MSRMRAARKIRARVPSKVKLKLKVIKRTGMVNSRLMLIFSRVKRKKNTRSL